jgi:Mrp family chromosome partitioning ATPase
MTFEQFCRIVIKRWKIVVICFVCVGLGAFIGSKLVKPIYQSTVLIEVVIHSGGTPLTVDNISASQQLVETEAQLATTDPVLGTVASRFPGLSVSDLAKEVTATSRTSTQLFEINVQDPSPTRAADIANAVAATLINQQLQATQQYLAESGFLVVAQPARPALSPVRPNKLFYTGAGLAIGLLLGMVLAVLFELSDTRVRTHEALTRLVDWPVLGTLWQAAPEEDVINPRGLNSNVESYGILHTNIGFAAIDRPLRTLVVTSGAPLDGKSTVAANLAIFMAKAGRNTLLIDADLRHPTQHEQFGIPAHAQGFSNAIMSFSMPRAANAPVYQIITPGAYTRPSFTPVVSSELTLDPFVQAVDIPNLCVMPSGPLPPNPPELLNSRAMQGFFAALSNCGAEVVIFDTPALLGVSDASILASKVDGTLVVVDISRASTGNLMQVKALLGQAGARVLGCVVNKQRRSRKDIPYANYSSTDKQSSKDGYSRTYANLPAGKHDTNNGNPPGFLPLADRKIGVRPEDSQWTNGKK